MERKLRYSRQRETIYQHLLATRDHPSAEMVYAALREELPELSLGTVYRNLRLLEELGRIRRVASFRGTERYDACCGDHAHFICAGCGAVRDVDETDMSALRAAVALPAGYRPDRLNLTVTGLCPDCLEKETVSK